MEMEEFNAQVEQAVKEWPAELKIYFMLVLYSSLTDTRRNEVLEHMKAIEDDKWTAKLKKLKGTMQ